MLMAARSIVAEYDENLRIGRFFLFQLVSIHPVT